MNAPSLHLTQLDLGAGATELPTYDARERRSTLLQPAGQKTLDFEQRPTLLLLPPASTARETLPYPSTVNPPSIIFCARGQLGQK